MTTWLGELDSIARNVLDEINFSSRLEGPSWLNQCMGMTAGEVIQQELDLARDN